MLQAGIFGLGPNSSLNQWVGRDDFSIQPLWQLEAFGIGNLARIKEQRGNESMAIIEFFKTQDMVAADVTRAQARVQSAAARVLQADRALRTGIITFNGNFEGLRQTTRLGNVLVLVNRPQEAVFALQLLKVAFDEYFTTVAEYNRAQFELFHALGYPARELASTAAPRRGPAGGHGRGRPTCPRWATGRPRQPAERTRLHGQGCWFLDPLGARGGLRPCINVRSPSFVPASSVGREATAQRRRCCRRPPSCTRTPACGHRPRTPADGDHRAIAVKPNFGYLVYRITNPNRFNNHLTPPSATSWSSQPSRCPARFTTCSNRREERDGANVRREQRVHGQVPRATQHPSRS